MSPHGYTIRTPGNPLLRAVCFVIVGVVLIAALLMGAKSVMFEAVEW